MNKQTKHVRYSKLCISKQFAYTHNLSVYTNNSNINELYKVAFEPGFKLKFKRPEK